MAKVFLILLLALVLFPLASAYYGYTAPTGGGSVIYSNVTVNVSHESLSGLLGGGANDHYHITGAQHTSLLSGITNWITNTVNDLANYFTKSQTEAYINANISSANTTMKNYVDQLNTTGLIKDWNSSGLIKDWNATGDIINWTYYVDSKLNTTFYNASTVQAIAGTTAGALADIQTYNQVSYNVTEASGTPGLDFRVNFTGITEFNQIIVRYKSGATEVHVLDIALWDSSSSSWESYRTVGVSPDYNIMTMNVYDITDHIVGGVVQVRFYISSEGTVAHKHQFDWVAISKGVATPSSSETDPYSVHLVGDTMTGNLNMSGANISINSGNKFCYTQACDKYSYYNGTAIIIQG
jgi:hypothetical protein